MDPSAPLLVSADPVLVAEVQRLAAAAGAVPEVVHDATEALRRWSTAPVALVGADLAEALAAVLPPRRPGVHLLAREPVADLVFRAALGVGAESVAGLPASDAWLVELLTDAGDGDRSTATVVGVVGGCGGAGATVLAAALATAFASAAPALLVDADPLGPGLDRVLGVERRDGVRWDSLQQTTGRLSARSLREALPTSGDLSVLTWPARSPVPLLPFAVREVLAAARRGFDAVVVDLPRHHDAVVEETLSRCDHVVLVTTLTVAGVASAARVAERLRDAGPARHLVTRGRGGVAPDAVGRLLRTPLLASMPDQRGLDEALDLGAGPLRSGRGVLARTARAVAVELHAAPTGRGAVAA